MEGLDMVSSEEAVLAQAQVGGGRKIWNETKSILGISVPKNTSALAQHLIFTLKGLPLRTSSPEKNWLFEHRPSCQQCLGGKLTERN